MKVFSIKSAPVIPKSRAYKLTVSLLIYHTFISTSLILPIFGFTGMMLILPNYIGIFSLIVFFSRRIKRWAIVIIFLILFFTFFKVAFFSEILFFKINVFLITTIILISVTNIEEFKGFIEVSSLIILVVLIGAIIGFVLSQLGFKPIFSYVANNERLHLLYYTSFGQSEGIVLRPSGIYDEPGTLAFMTGCLLVLRHIFSENQKLSIVILFLGFITFSLAFLVFSIIYVLAIDFKKGQRFGILMVLAVFLVLIYLSGFDNLLEDNLFSRFTLSQDSRQGIRGGRETLFWTAYDNLSLSDGSIYWGVNPYCTINSEECLKKGYMSENPLGPIAEHGIFIAWPYYIFLLICIIISFKGRRYLIFLALMSLFLQRPYLLNYGVSLLGILPIHLFYKRKEYHLNL